MFHNYHILSLSVYPYLFFFCTLRFSSSLVIFFKFGFFNFFSFFCLVFLMFLWFKDIYMEGLSGFHNFLVQDGFKFGIVFFVFSEFMFFFSVFWFFFDSSLVPLRELGEIWRPLGLSLVNPFGVPLLNSCILLRSGVRVTWSHYSLLSNYEGGLSLILTCVLALYFIFIQYLEYQEANFSFCDGVYGSIFFFSTGFHGLHVFFGGIFLFYNYLRLYYNHFNFIHHLGFEFSIIYWHFVDVVWLFLFIFVYWWSY